MPTPYVSFDGNCAEAFAFYAKTLDGKVEFSQTFGESPASKDVPPEAQDKVMHATVRLLGERLMGSDRGPWAPFEGPMRSVSLSLDFTDEAKAKAAFTALGEGGKVEMPFEKTFWAKGFGILKDRFGVSWMVNLD